MVYHVQSEQISLGKRIARTAVVVLAAGVAQYFWFYRSGKLSHGEDWLLDSVVLGMVTFFLDSRRREYDLEVDDEKIRVRNASLSIGNGRVSAEVAFDICTSRSVACFASQRCDFRSMVESQGFLWVEFGYPRACQGTNRSRLRQ